MNKKKLTGADIGVEDHPDYGLDPAAFLDSTEDQNQSDNFYRPIKVQELDELCQQSRRLDSEQQLVLDILLK